jgi:hypothetical protein
MCGAFVALLFAASPTQAEVIHVPGDAATPRLGLLQAIAGDTVLVASIEWYDPGPAAIVRSGVTLRGEGEWSSQQYPFPTIPAFRGFGVDLEEGPEPSIVERIWFVDNPVNNYNAQGVIRQCRFDSHTPGFFPWADNRVIRLDRGGRVEDSFLYLPSAGLETAVDAGGGNVVITNTVFATSAFTDVRVHGGWPQWPTDHATVRNCTFWDGGVGLNAPGADVSFVNNITAGGVGCTSGSEHIAHNCFVDWLHIGASCVPADSNFVADPIFCGDFTVLHPSPYLEDYFIDAGSPCVGTGENGSDIGALGVGCGTTAVSERPVPPTRLPLAVAPNPVLNGATFTFDPTVLPQWLEIYDPTGKLVQRLRPGPTTTWRPSNGTPRGVYFARLTAQGVSETVKFIVLK